MGRSGKINNDKSPAIVVVFSGVIVVGKLVCETCTPLSCRHYAK